MLHVFSLHVGNTAVLIHWFIFLTYSNIWIYIYNISLTTSFLFILNNQAIVWQMLLFVLVQALTSSQTHNVAHRWLPHKLPHKVQQSNSFVTHRWGRAMWVLTYPRHLTFSFVKWQLRNFLSSSVQHQVIHQLIMGSISSKSRSSYNRYDTIELRNYYPKSDLM